MIVVDTNTIAYFLLSNPPNDHSQDIDQLVEREADWIAPYLWRSEFRNILTTYVRKKLLDIQSAIEIQLQAERILLQNEYQVDSKQVLMLAADSGW
jgi:predicted nucleic acid-binding protein